jgi:4-hydroxybenzoate polyprenyltransferase
MSAPAHERRAAPLALLAALRPRQWPKNLFVFAAVVLTGQLADPTAAAHAAAAFVLFCLASSAVYLLNDVVDVRQDRLHPEKRFRPLAAGELSPAAAVAMAVVLGCVAVLGGTAVNQLLGWVIAAYLALQLGYNFAFKHMVIVEVLAIAGGFVLRVLAGGAAISRPISPYLYLSMIFLALFQGFSKRRHELSVMAEAAGEHRPSLSHYTIDLLDDFIVIAATATIVTYSLYAIETPARPPGISANVLLLTIPFVLYAVFRYLYLVRVEGKGGTPEDILLTDGFLLLDVAAWAASLLVILYVLPHLLG